jgi:hypothetical protein
MAISGLKEPGNLLNVSQDWRIGAEKIVTG